MLKKKENGYASNCSRAVVAVLTGCQINPYIFQPDWTSPSWFDAGKEDAMNGLSVKDNRAPPIVLTTHTLIVANIFAAMLTVRRKSAKKGLFTHGD